MRIVILSTRSWNFKGFYQQAINLLHALSYTLRMSYKAGYKIKIFFRMLSRHWKVLMQEGSEGMDYSKKDALEWISILRLPEFASKEDFEWAKVEVT